MYSYYVVCSFLSRCTGIIFKEFLSSRTRSGREDSFLLYLFNPAPCKVGHPIFLCLSVTIHIEYFILNLTTLNFVKVILC
jgi:hypothetical protein